MKNPYEGEQVRIHISHEGHDLYFLGEILQFTESDITLIDKYKKKYTFSRVYLKSIRPS